MDLTAPHRQNSLIHIFSMANSFIPIVGVFGGAIYWKHTKSKSHEFNEHGKENLNYAINFIALLIINMISLFYLPDSTIIIAYTTSLIGVLLPVYAAYKAWRGQFFKYPLVYRFIK
jgi:uncharacterized Tic20 family protein